MSVEIEEKPRCLSSWPLCVYSHLQSKIPHYLFCFVFIVVVVVCGLCFSFPHFFVSCALRTRVMSSVCQCVSLLLCVHNHSLSLKKKRCFDVHVWPIESGKAECYGTVVPAPLRTVCTWSHLYPLAVSLVS